MPRLSALSGSQVARALERGGFAWRRRVGSHGILKYPDTRRTVAVPLHGARDFPAGTLPSIVRDAGLTVDEFIRLLR